MRGRLIILLVCALVLTLVAAPAAFAAPIAVTGHRARHGGPGDDCRVLGLRRVQPPARACELAAVRAQRWLSRRSTATRHGSPTTGLGRKCRFTIPASATLGWYDLSQQNGSSRDGRAARTRSTWTSVPSSTWVDPASLPAGPTPRAITVHGRHFYGGILGGSRILGQRLRRCRPPITFPDRLTATIPAAHLVAPGQSAHPVLNPGPCPVGDAAATPYWLPVYGAAVDRVDQPHVGCPGGPAFTLDVYGANFATGLYGAVVVWVVQDSSGNAVFWNSTDLATVRDSPDAPQGDRTGGADRQGRHGDDQGAQRGLDPGPLLERRRPSPSSSRPRCSPASQPDVGVGRVRQERPRSHASPAVGSSAARTSR